MNEDLTLSFSLGGVVLALCLAAFMFGRHYEFKKWATILPQQMDNLCTECAEVMRNKLNGTY